MACPFLKESEVRFCEVSPVRKMIPHAEGPSEREKCSSGEHASCALLEGRDLDAAGRPECPFLRDSLVQYCAAAPITRFIPYTEALLSCCLTEGYRYCDLYISWADPGRASRARRPQGLRGSGLEVPPHLAFSRNHMWLDLQKDGSWHVGLDGFFAAAVEDVERVTFLTPPGLCHPTAVITVSGVDVPMVFPERLDVTGVNVSLRNDPGKVVTDPYSRGWLFEGRRRGEGGHDHLLRGDAALEWMRGESMRLAEFSRLHRSSPATSSAELVNDGGLPVAPFALNLDRDDRLQLWNDFFSLRSAGRES